ncbi:MAG: DUF4292 domain-containing protein [Tannerellaceae bacterium]|jgi:hypothetical protein|nr:DUF4292 domain-containing protein [Tannerellaceae bacterium]
MKARSNITLLLLALLLLAGCRSRRQIETVTVEAKGTAQFFESMQKRYPLFRTMSARTSVEIGLPGYEMKSRMDLKMITDSILQLSFQPMLGMEVLRVEFSRDSVKMVDRLNRQYLVESYEQLNKTSPIAINLYNIQALLANRIFSPGQRNTTPAQYSRFRIRHRDGLSELQTSDNAGIAYSFTADAEEKLLATTVADAIRQYNLLCRYSDFKDGNGLAFPMRIKVQVDGSEHKAFDLGISFSRIQLDLPLNLSFPISANYRRVSLHQLIKALNLE